MKTKVIFLIDAFIGLVFSIGLLIFPENIVNWLGLPSITNRFYPVLLGASFLGISIALIIEYYRKNDVRVGLGYTGAAAIDFTIGISLGLLLIFGNLNIPAKGQIFLWVMVILLISISVTEFFSRKE